MRLIQFDDDFWLDPEQVATVNVYTEDGEQMISVGLRNGGGWWTKLATVRPGALQVLHQYGCHLGDHHVNTA